MHSDTFCGNFIPNGRISLEISGVFMEKIWEIKLGDNLHIDFTIKSQKSITLYTVSILFKQFPHIMEKNLFSSDVYHKVIRLKSCHF